jgi:glutamate 5-kinase
LKELSKNYKRIVVKIGSSLFCGQKANFDLSRFDLLAAQISRLVHDEARQVLVVSSGAIALGMDIMGLEARPRELAYLQAAAAIGQNALMDNYTRAFKAGRLKCAQVLLTWDDFDDRRRYLNAKNTLLALLKLKSVPVINENDTISTDEIKFGDNDRLSALVATLISADLLIILSDVDGLLDKEKKVIQKICEVNHRIKELACPTDKKACVGGMVTKIEAAKIAVDSGIPCVIANGRNEGIISKIIASQDLTGEWSLFLPRGGSLAERKRWIAFGTKPKGRIAVDDGARQALLNKKSLLSVGITDVSGVFEAGEIVSITDKQGLEFARGKSGLSSRQLDKVKGSRFHKEAIHRDNIVIL